MESQWEAAALAAPASRALILDPSYGEYAHVLENVIKCSVERFPLYREDGYVVDLESLEAELSKGYDLAVLVNPNNPTGQQIPRQSLEEMLSRVSPDTKFWIDEAYVDYVDHRESLEGFAAASQNVVVCKTMSNVYALSGLRVGYLCGHKGLIEDLRMISPPWSVSLPGQMAAVMALQDPEYYSEVTWRPTASAFNWRRTCKSLGDLEIVPGVANYFLCHLPPHGPNSEETLDRCRVHNLFLRDVAATSTGLGPRVFRIAVKDAATNRRMVEILSSNPSVRARFV